MVPMALALLLLMMVVFIQEPLALVLFVGLVWALRALWRAHRAVLRRREQRT